MAVEDAERSARTGVLDRGVPNPIAIDDSPRCYFCGAMTSRSHGGCADCDVRDEQRRYDSRDRPAVSLPAAPAGCRWCTGCGALTTSSRGLCLDCGGPG